MKYEIKNRLTGALQFTAEIDAKDSDATSIKTGLAVKWAFKSAANLGDADLRDADLSDADLRGADLRGADLRGANLRGADLGSIPRNFLRGARPQRPGTSENQWIIQGPTRSGGHQFFYSCA